MSPQRWLSPSGIVSEPYYDEVIYSNDGGQFKWLEHIQERFFPSLQSLATRRYNEGIRLHLEMPFSTQTLEILLKHVKGEPLPEDDWLQIENVLAELEKRKELELVRIREDFIKKMVNRRCVGNCIGLWRMTRRLRSPQSQEIFNYILEVLIRSVKQKTIDLHFFTLTLFELMMFLSHDGLKAKNEVEVCQTGLAWVDAWPEKRRCFIREVITLVRKEGLPDSTKKLAGRSVDSWRLSYEKARTNGYKLLILGGHQDGPTDDVLILDYVNESWEELSLKLPYQAAYHGAVWLGGELYIFGGGNNTGTHFNQLYKLTLHNKKWEQLAPMNESRCYITNSSVELDGKIYVIGGHNGSRALRTRLRSMEYYNPHNNSWTPSIPMNQSRSDACAAVVNGKIFVCGGFNGREVLSTVEWFDPQSEIWTDFKPLPEPRAGLSAFPDGSGSLIVLGGFNGRDRFGNQWKICVEEGSEAKWENLPPLKQGRSNFSVAKLGNEIVVIGGYCDKTVALVEFFDGVEWKKGPSLTKGRSALKAIAVPLDAGTAIREQFKPI